VCSETDNGRILSLSMAILCFRSATSSAVSSTSSGDFGINKTASARKDSGVFIPLILDISKTDIPDLSAIPDNVSPGRTTCSVHEAKTLSRETDSSAFSTPSSVYTVLPSSPTTRVIVSKSTSSISGSSEANPSSAKKPSLPDVGGTPKSLPGTNTLPRSMLSYCSAYASSHTKPAYEKTVSLKKTLKSVSAEFAA